MASFHKRLNKDGSEVWRVQFRKKNPKTKKIESYSFSTDSLEKAEKMAELWEPIFYFEGKKAIPHNREYERVQRRFRKKSLT